MFHSVFNTFSFNSYLQPHLVFPFPSQLKSTVYLAFSCSIFCGIFIFSCREGSNDLLLYGKPTSVQNRQIFKVVKKTKQNWEGI